MPARRARRISRRTVMLSLLGAAAVTLYCVLVPLQAAAYGTDLLLSFILAGAVCAAPLMAVPLPRTATAVFLVGALPLALLVTARGGTIAPWPWPVPTLLSFLLLVAVVAFRHGARLGLLPVATGLAAGMGVPLVRPDVLAGDPATANLIVTASLAVAAYLFALLVAGRMRVAEELTREREHSALEESRRMLVEERTRIARELHDVIAHSMSVIQVQASTARYRLPALDDAAASEFDDIAATARSSLAEMRRMLGVLRTEDHDAQLAPQQGIADLPALIDTVRRAGAEVELSLDAGDAVATAPQGVQIAVFRIVQEALSNAVRHAPGATVRVRVRADTADVHIRVENDPPASTPTGHGAGYGLRGMRERAELLGGSLSSGPTGDGGWAVEARLPVTPGAPAAGAGDEPHDREKQ